MREQRALKDTGEQDPKLSEIIDEFEEKINIEEPSVSVDTETNNDENENGADDDDDEPLMEIGTWSNDMAGDVGTFSPEFESNFAASCGMVCNLFNSDL